MSSLRRSPRIAAAAATPTTTSTQCGRISKAPARFTDERFHELPMANNKYTKGRHIVPGMSIVHERSSSKYGSTDSKTLEFIKDSVNTLQTASVDEALDILEKIMDDLHAIMDSAPENEDLNDALCLFYNAYENAEDLSESNAPGKLLRKICKEAQCGYQLLAENVSVI